MSQTNETPPAARQIFFTGALQMLDRLERHFAAERERIEWELVRTKKEMTQTNTPAAG